MQDYKHLPNIAIRSSRLLLLSSMLPILASCAEDFDMDTHVNADGTCSRQISFRADSATFVGGGYLAGKGDNLTRGICSADLIADEIWTDNTWEKSWIDKTSHDHHPLPMTPKEFSRLHNEAIAQNQPLEDSVRVCLRRDFSSVEAMSAAMPFTIQGEPLEAQSNFQKKFRWFYTDYTFTETIRCIGNRYPISYSDYLTKEELICWFTDDASGYKGHSGQENLQMLERIEEKVDKWYSALFYYESLEAIAQHYEEVKDAPMPLEQFRQMQSSLTANAVSLGFNVGKLSTKEGDYKLFTNFLTRQLDSDAYEKALEQSPVLAEAMDRVGESLIEVLALNVHYHVTLIDKDQDFVLKGFELIARDYTVSITARQKNLWAYIVSLLICCIAGCSFLIRKKTK